MTTRQTTPSPERVREARDAWYRDVARRMLDAYEQQLMGGPVFGITAAEANYCRSLILWMEWDAFVDHAKVACAEFDPAKPADSQKGEAKRWAEAMERMLPKLPRLNIRPDWWPDRDSKGSCPEEVVASTCGWLWWNRGAGRNRDDKPTSFDLPMIDDDLLAPAYELLETSKRAQREQQRRTIPDEEKTT